MKQSWKKLAGICLALSMVFSATGCDAILNGISDAFQSVTQSSTPNSSTPNSSTPNDSSPNDSTPDDSTPDDSTPGDSAPDDSTGGNTTPDDSTGGDVITSDNLSIHFLELGNRWAGDCTYIKAGDVDILIDAGSRDSSATTIETYVDQYCEDGKLEYVIATHAHQDHIAGFVGKKDVPGILEYYDVGTIIDFPRTDADSKVFENYTNLRDGLVANKGTKHYTALDWWNGVDGLTRSLEIAEGITMTVLYQKYYESNSSEENNYSVCVMLSENDNKVPTQTFINNVAPYTDQIFVTTLAVNSSDGKTTGHRSMNGNIVVSAKGNSVTVNCSNNNTILKETEWFKANRTWPSNGV